MPLFRFPQRFQMRGATAEECAASNEVLLEREVKFETDTGYFKIGDGVTPWNDLDYVVGPDSGGGGGDANLPAVMARISMRF